MKTGTPASSGARTYQAPRIYVGTFYGALVAWTVICISLIGLKVTRSEWGDAFQLFTIAFIMAMTWYFSMGVYYRLRIDADGTVQLTSFTRVLQTRPGNVTFIEGPHLPVGFVRFQLEGEKAYLFSVMRNVELQEILLGIWKANPALRVKNLRILNRRSEGS